MSVHGLLPASGESYGHMAAPSICELGLNKSIPVLTINLANQSVGCLIELDCFAEPIQLQFLWVFLWLIC